MEARAAEQEARLQLQPLRARDQEGYDRARGEVLRESGGGEGRLLRGEASPEELRRLTREAFEEAAKLEERWLAAVKPSPCLNPLYALFWRRVNRAARIPA